VPRAISCLLTALLCCVALGAAAQQPSPMGLNAQLLVAARQGDLPTLSRLLDKGAAPNSRNRLGKTSLLIAAEKGQMAMVERLLAVGADVQQASLEGVTPLIGAVKASRDARLVPMLRSRSARLLASVRAASISLRGTVPSRPSRRCTRCSASCRCALSSASWACCVPSA